MAGIFSLSEKNMHNASRSKTHDAVAYVTITGLLAASVVLFIMLSL